MSKYVYPAKLSNDDGHLMVEFPDIPNCFTEGDTLVEALELAEDALSMMLAEREDNDQVLPKPTNASAIHCGPGETVALVKADTLEYRKRTSTKAVKKTLTIPSWMNAIAEKHGVNYSLLLQEALSAHLGLKD